MNMFPSSTSSSSQGSMGPSGTNSGGGGLMRYGSAPSSLLTTAVDSVIGSNREFSAFAPQSQLASARFFPSEASESAAPKPNVKDNTAIGLQRSYGFTGGGGSSSSSLVRHSSSPAGFLNHLAAAAATGDNGFSITRGIGSSYNSKGIAENGHNVSRLNSQLSFTRPKEALSRISEETDSVGDGDNGKRRSSNHSNNTACFEMGLWDDQDNPLTFSVKQPKTISTHVVNCPDTMESQFQFGMPQAALELTPMDKLMHIPQDSVPCKIRAKRGFATHPRSIAERERRTRISGKLKKLQDLVPNMDKQTSYADMLDLAVQHIKTLQNQIQKLNNEVDSCTCGCKKTTDS